MKVIISREAIEDLVSIGDHIGRDNPARSEIFVEELYEKCFSLSETPFAFERIAHRTDRDLRKRRHGKYLILYEIHADRI